MAKRFVVMDTETGEAVRLLRFGNGLGRFLLGLLCGILIALFAVLSWIAGNGYDPMELVRGEVKIEIVEAEEEHGPLLAQSSDGKVKIYKKLK